MFRILRSFVLSNQMPAALFLWAYAATWGYGQANGDDPALKDLLRRQQRSGEMAEETNQLTYQV